MKVWRNFKTYVEAKPSLSRRKCFSSCYICRQQWEATKTENVHMTRVQIDGSVDTRFLCDDCLKTIDND